MRPTGADAACGSISMEVPTAVIEAVAQRAAEIVLERLRLDDRRPKYLAVTEAAELMRAKPQRIYDLLSSGRLTRHKDGCRVLVSRAEIEIYLAAGALSPVAPALPRGSQRRINADPRR
jgi:excisionase family DNA binding protein